MGGLELTRFFKLTVFTCFLAILVSCGGGGSGKHTSATAEELESVKVSGKVFDSKGEFVPGASIDITNDPYIQTTANQWGEFSARVTVGDHILTVTRGNAVLFQKQFTARAGFTTHLGDLLPGSPYVINEGENLTDSEAISSFWKTFETLYVLKPSELAVTAWVNCQVSVYFVDSGLTRDDLIEDLVNDPSVHIGKTITADIIDEYDMRPAYTKAYLVRIRGFDSKDLLEVMVHDGTKWLWSGNCRWMETSIRSLSCMWVYQSGMYDFGSGFEISLENDDSNYAYNQGVRSAVVSGPGLPSPGLFFEYQSDNTWMSIYGTSDSSYYGLSDNAIAGIEDDAEYTFTLYADTVDDLMNNGTDSGTALQSFTETIQKPPIPRSLLRPDRFASLTEPSSHFIASLNFGGPITVRWTNPAGTISGEVLLAWTSSSKGYQLEDDNQAGKNTVALDSTGLPAPDGGAGLFIRVTDEYDRDYNLAWFF